MEWLIKFCYYGFFIMFLSWTIFIVKFFNKFINKDLKFTETLDPNIDQLHKPFERYDRKNWCLPEIYLCAIFLFPLRIIVFFSAMIFLWIFHFIVRTNKVSNIQLEFPFWRRISTRFVSSMVARILLFSAGIYHIKVHKRNIQDYDPTYPYNNEQQKSFKAPIIISNHISALETIISSYLYCPSFLAKLDVANYPLFGVGTKGLQSIFVDRDNEQNKNKIMDDIKFRADQIQAGKNLPPIMIFPEGTTTNGRYLLTFKKGAYEHFLPTRIVCFQFNERHFNPTLDSIPIHFNTLLLLCQWQNIVNVYELGVFNPDYLNLKDPEDWQIYANKTKQIILKCLNIKDSQSGFRNMKDYYAVLDKVKKELKEKEVNKKQK